MLTLGGASSSASHAADQSAFFDLVTSSFSPSTDDLYRPLPWNSSSATPGPLLINRSSPEDIFDQHRPRIAAFNRFVTPVLYAIGLPGNFLSFAVWIRPRMRPSSGCYLAALALTDFVFIVLHVCFELQFTWRAIGWLELPVLCELFPVVFLASQYLSLLLVLGFSVERYIAVCHPFQRDRYCSTSRALTVIASLTVLSVLLNGVQAYFWTHTTEPEARCDIRKEVTSSSDGDGNRTSVWVVWSWLTEMLIFAAVPFLIFVLNVMVVVEYRKVTAKELELTGSVVQRGGSGRRRSRSMSRSRHSAQSSATTVMLLAVSFYLIVSTLPVTICYVLYPSFEPGSLSLSDSEVGTDPAWQRYFDYWAVRYVVQELGMSHFAFNFFIYLSTGRIFRRELRTLVFFGGRGRGCGPRGGGGGGSRGRFGRYRTASQTSRDFGTNGLTTTGCDDRHSETVFKCNEEISTIRPISA